MDIYAPLAERVGMYEYMREMQLLAFEQLEPEAYATITGRLAQIRSQEGGQVDAIALAIKQALAEAGLQGRGLGARKAPLFDLEEDGRTPCQLRTDHRHHGLPRADRKRRATATARSGVLHTDLAVHSRPLQGLHLDPQVERLPLAAHLADL